MKDTTKRKGTQQMPPVTRKLGPGVVVRPKGSAPEPGHAEGDPSFKSSEQVFRRKK